MPKRSEPRVYWRNQGGEKRAYGDFRAYEDVGGGREALIPKSHKRATTDSLLAQDLFTKRLKELEKARRYENLFGVKAPTTLNAYAVYHLEKKAQEGAVTAAWMKEAQRHLTAAVDHFGEERDLVTIDPEACSEYTELLLQRSNGRGGKLSRSTVRKYIYSLSDMFARAVSEGYAQMNPVQGMYSKPTEERREAKYLEAHEAALLLEAARTYQPAGLREQEHGGAISAGAYPWIHPLLATFLLTGGRKSEVLGLEVDDVSFRLGKLFFRPNEHRRLKTRMSERRVPLWPQLEEILKAYMADREREGGLGRLLFPSDRSEKEKMLDNVDRSLDTIAKRAGFKAGEIRCTMFRHTYATQRLQTTDHGAPVSIWTVARELGHKSTNMIEDRYGHLADAPHRSEVVEYRVENHKKKLAKSLKRLRELDAQET